jgi:hypothetical protein
MLVRVPPVTAMVDETLMLHLEKRHSEDLAMRFLPEPEREERRLNASIEWRTYHEYLHRIQGDEYDHEHNPA